MDSGREIFVKIWNNNNVLVSIVISIITVSYMSHGNTAGSQQLQDDDGSYILSVYEETAKYLPLSSIPCLLIHSFFLYLSI